MADTNPANFANRTKEEVQAIASMGGKAAHEKVCPYSPSPLRTNYTHPSKHHSRH